MYHSISVSLPLLKKIEFENSVLLKYWNRVLYSQNLSISNSYIYHLHGYYSQNSINITFSRNKNKINHNMGYNLCISWDSTSSIMVFDQKHQGKCPDMNTHWHWKSRSVAGVSHHWLFTPCTLMHLYAPGATEAESRMSGYTWYCPVCLLLFLGKPCTALLTHRATSSPVRGPPGILREDEKERMKQKKRRLQDFGWSLERFQLCQLPAAAAPQLVPGWAEGSALLYSGTYSGGGVWLETVDWHSTLHFQGTNRSRDAGRWSESVVWAPGVCLDTVELAPGVDDH